MDQVTVQRLLQADNEAHFRAMADLAPVMIWRTDDRGCVTFFNRPWLDFTGRGLEEELAGGRSQSVHPEDRAACEAQYAEAVAERRAFQMEYRLRRHDGVWRWVLDHGRPHSVDGQLVCFFGSCVDITDLRVALDERRQMLEEREALLAELHHRVKNNAQATSSFLSLQASRATDPVVAMALRGASARVLLAGLVQDRMFRVGNDAHVELGEELTATSRAAMDLAGRSGITLDLRIEARLEVPVRQAAPVALMVNELITNAVKHAYPPGRRGAVRLVVRQRPDGAAEVVVQDDGIGLPPALHYATPHGGLGLDLSRRLARQAKAELTLEAGSADGGHGTTASIRFMPV